MLATASTYRRVRIAAWSAISIAGDATSAWTAVTGGTSALSCNPHWGWMGRCGGDQAELATTTARQVLAVLPAGRLAVGLGSSKGRLAQHAAGAGAWSGAAPGWEAAHLAAELGLGAYLPCACAAACSTGLASLLAAADLIERGQADGALVGCAEASLTPLVLAGFRNAGVLCGTNLPRAFAEPTGFAPAEGAAAMALGPHGAWRLVAGVRLGDAGHETHFTDPATLARALEALWAHLPRPDLIACHATGTAAGDAYELAGLEAGPWRSSPRWCAKPWLGHTLGASGLVELATCLSGSANRIWKLSLGFGGHLIAVALER